jgi:hypothetical protein
LRRDFLVGKSKRVPDGDDPGVKVLEGGLEILEVHVVFEDNPKGAVLEGGGFGWMGVG